MSGENVHQLRNEYTTNAKERRGGSGGTGGGGSDLDSRIAALEKSVPEIREKLVRIETQLEGLVANTATKNDLLNETAGLNLAIANFRSEITKLESTMIKWYLVTALALTGGIGTIAFSLARALK